MSPSLNTAENFSTRSRKSKVGPSGVIFVSWSELGPQVGLVVARSLYPKIEGKYKSSPSKKKRKKNRENKKGSEGNKFFFFFHTLVVQIFLRLKKFQTNFHVILGFHLRAKKKKKFTKVKPIFISHELQKKKKKPNVYQTLFKKKIIITFFINSNIFFHKLQTIFHKFQFLITFYKL